MLTASTARGQTYQFTLPDGTKVWLNADSKISFPSQFSGEERKILLDGEGYFEVAHNKKQPFRVESKGQTVEVLGTHFNINAYKNEIVTTTTLLEGSVRVAAFNSATGRENIMLKPNQQSILNSNGAQVLNVDVSTVVGWKNGLFTYKNTQLSIVMRQIERWYNVSVHYNDNNESLKERLLSGSVSRYDNVSGILRAIELTGAVKFKVKDKTITVYQQ
jgi:ferric-dicitrate binding protein FerR (iron transport regulator)